MKRLYLFGPGYFKCNDCGFEFAHPVNRGNGGYPEEEWYECPRCGSTDYDPVDEIEADNTDEMSD